MKFNTNAVEIEVKGEVPSMLDKDKENISVLNATKDNGIFFDKRMMKSSIISRMAVCGDEKVKQNIIESVVTQMILQYDDESIKQTKFGSKLTQILMVFGDEKISKMKNRDYSARKLPPKPGGYAFNKSAIGKYASVIFRFNMGIKSWEGDRVHFPKCTTMIIRLNMGIKSWEGVRVHTQGSVRT